MDQETPKNIAPVPAFASTHEALKAARETRSLEIGPSALSRLGRVFRQQFGERAAVIVADLNTFAAAGEGAMRALQDAGVNLKRNFIFSEPGLYAESRHVESLEASLRWHRAIPVAVGSGTINDLTKLAAHRAGRRPYVCVATAASMDGYTAFGASITHEGSKQTFWCPAPAVVVADLDVISAAPAEMNAWGYADLLAKVTAGADWLMADALGVEPLHGQAWALVQGRLREMVADPEGVRAGKAEALGQLVEGLMLGGFAMQAAQSSRPASGAEHQFSHLWDMQHHSHNGRAPSHGFKVGLGTLASAALYEQLLQRPLAQLAVEACCAAWPGVDQAIEQARGWVKRHDGGEALEDVALQEVRAKYVDRQHLRAQLELLREKWPELRARLLQQLLSVASIREKLKAAGAPTEPAELGLTRQRLRASYWQAYCIRRRFTVLDVAMRTGLLAPSLDEIFAARGAFESERGDASAASAE